jgi:hypothetical protein
MRVSVTRRAFVAGLASAATALRSGSRARAGAGRPGRGCRTRRRRLLIQAVDHHWARAAVILAASRLPPPIFSTR